MKVSKKQKNKFIETARAALGRRRQSGRIAAGHQCQDIGSLVGHVSLLLNL